MNRVLVGTDIVLISRVKKLGASELANRVLSSRELLELEKITDAQRKLQFIAGRFAVKEAYFKASPSKNFKYNELSTILINDTLVLSLCGKAVENASVSISHDGDYAVATVILTV